MADLKTKEIKRRLPDVVRDNTGFEINTEIDRRIVQCLEQHAEGASDQITEHIAELDREWDVERALQANAGAIALSGAVLAATVNPRWLAVPAVVFGFLFQHAVQGWCPPLPVLRRIGYRTRKEIDREKYGLKALRGDFDMIANANPE